MAAFTSVAQADARAQAKGPAGDRTWAYAHGARNMNGQICIVVKRWQTNPATGFNMALVELTDDAAV